MNTQYRISVLDKSRLPEVYRLAHDANVEAGHIRNKPDGMFINHRDIDESEDTVLIGAIRDSELIGTCSVSTGNDCRQLIEALFPEEYRLINAVQPINRLSTIWRLATTRAFRASRGLITDIIHATLKVSGDIGIETLLLMFAEHHTRFYKKRLGAKAIATKRVQYEDHEMNVVLMTLNVRSAYQKFKARRKPE